MVRESRYEAVYEVANQWRDRCLADDKSLLWPNEVTWTIESIDLMLEVLKRKSAGERRDFSTQMDYLLNELPSEIHRLFADLTGLWSLMAGNYEPSDKLKWLDHIISAHGLQKADEKVRIVEAYETRISEKEGSSGLSATQRIPQMRAFLEFSKMAKTDPQILSNRERSRVAAFEACLRTSMSKNAQDMLLYLLFPDEFEPITSQAKKREILSGLGIPTAKADDLDAAMKQLRPRIAEQLGRKDFSFHDEDVLRIWRPDQIKRTWLFQANPEKCDFGTQLKKMSVGEVDSWSVSRFREEMKDGHRILIWQSGENSGLLALGEIIGDPFLRPKGTGIGTPDPNLDEWAISFKLNVILQQPIVRKSFLDHPLLAKMQIIKQPQGTNFKVSPEEWKAISELLQITRDQLERKSVDKDLLETALAELSALSNLEAQELEEIQSLLREKKQLIFEGPPGAGKTYLADLFSRYFTGNSLTGDHNEQIEIVQFHQSYGYEDFVQGIRPMTDGAGNLQYRVVPGIFLQMCDRARKNPQQNFVLIIDEINRGNLSRIFGELLMLLEYREKRVRLPYAPADSSDESGYISIPTNLYLIGTMNSTDRSLAMIDYALRRRFYFYRLMPVEGGNAPVLIRWLTSQSSYSPAERATVLDYFLFINREISQKLAPDFQIGHSYFMVQDINTLVGRRRVWQRSLRPLLEEYFHSHRDAESLIAPLAPDIGNMQHIAVAASPTVHAQTDSSE